jgi:ubiquinone/menaquinone biosynthesis C-methylase UbiE
MAYRSAKSTRAEPAGLVIHSAARYDFIVWLFTLGGERRFRNNILRLADLQAGETVLDIGCGTGTLAVLAKAQVGPEGRVYGVDASPEMIGHAQEKARKAKAEVQFAQATAQTLPYADASIDVVLSTLMLHHLPKKARPEIAREIRRVLKPGGRFLAVDFAKPAAGQRNLMDHFHRHGFIKLDDFIPQLEEAGLSVVRSAEVGERNLHYVVAMAGPNFIRPGGTSLSTKALADHVDDREHSHAGTPGHWMLAAVAAPAALVLLAMHAGLVFTLLKSMTGLKVAPVIYAGIAALLAVALAAHILGGRVIAALVGARVDPPDAK